MVEAFSPEQIVTGSKLQEPWTHVDCPGRRIVAGPLSCVQSYVCCQLRYHAAHQYAVYHTFDAPNACRLCVCVCVCTVVHTHTHSTSMHCAPTPPRATS